MTYIPDYKTSIQDETFINRKQYKVYLYSLSEEFYRYLKSLNEQKNNELGNVELAPMRATYTNVENGFGLVGGCCLRQTEWMELSESETQLDFDHAVFNVEYNADPIKRITCLFR